MSTSASKHEAEHLAQQVSDPQTAGRCEGNWEHCSSVLVCLLMHLLLNVVGGRELRPLI